jgi:catechol 2,3-dioxygenase-like lactoylglutathione lyase family enzyme
MSRPRVFATTTVLTVADLPRSLAFYAKLGFVEPATWGEPPAFAMLNRDGFDLMLSCGPARPNGPAGVWDLHLRIADLAAEEDALRTAGVAIDKGPVTTAYGMYELEVVDPDGHRVCFGQDIERRPEDRDR